MKKFNKAYLVTGVNGVGKSTILQQIVNNNPKSFCLFPASIYFMESLGLRSGDYDSLRNLPEQDKIIAFNKLMETTLAQKNKSEKGVLLIDAHIFNYKEGEMIERTGNWMHSLDAIFLITINPNILLKRIDKDKKFRNLFPLNVTRQEKLKMMKIYLNNTKIKAKEISKKYKIPFFLIENSTNKLNQVIDDFLKKIK